MNLNRYDGLPVRLVTTDGDRFEGRADTFYSGYGLHVYNREEEGIQLGSYIIFRSMIQHIEVISEGRLCDFYGAEFVPDGVRSLYRELRQVWCPETCTPGLRSEWSAENPALGQCSVTAFLVQELFGGKVCGIPMPGGGTHCYNVLENHEFDLTSEQFGDEEPDYGNDPEQSREQHFMRTEKKARYELLKKLLEEYRSRQNTACP